MRTGLPSMLCLCAAGKREQYREIYHSCHSKHVQCEATMSSFHDQRQTLRQVAEQLLSMANEGKPDFF